MNNNTTVSKLNEMSLYALAESFQLQLKDLSFHKLSFEERFGLMVDSEWNRKKSNQINRLIQRAGLELSNANVHDIEYHPDRKLDSSLITKLSTCNFIKEKHNIILLGATGAGKTYISCALGLAACQLCFSVKYIRLPDLLAELWVSREKRSYLKVIQKYRKFNLLILDEWLLSNLHANESRDIFDIIEARHQTGSTIFSSQFNPEGWHERIGENTMADAILDRIIHNSYTISIEGKESMRKRKGINSKSK